MDYPPKKYPLFLKVFSKPLLLVGTHAVAGVERYLLGSTAEEVLRKVSCPIITVGPLEGSPTPSAPHFRKILFATNFSATSLGAVPLITALCLATSATLRVAHVATDSTSDAEVSMLFEPIIKTLRQSSVGNAKIELECVVLHGSSVSRALVCDAEGSEADLLVLGVKRASSIASSPLAESCFSNYRGGFVPGTYRLFLGAIGCDRHNVAYPRDNGDAHTCLPQ